MQSARNLYRAVLLAFGLLGVFTSGAAFPGDTPAADDRFMLQDLISRYGRTYDDREAGAWTALFTENATLSLYLLGKLVREINSNDERRSWAQSRFDTFDKDGVIKTRHFQTNTLLERLGDGAVEGTTVFSVTYQYAAEATPRLVHTGVYRDRFVKTASGWKFAKREISIDHK